MLPSLPSSDLLRKQADWLAPARARLLRKANIAQRRAVLDLACGSGAVTEELVRRSGGEVQALDCSFEALQHQSQPFAGARRVCGRGEQLPFADQSFDLVFCQFALLWLDIPRAIEEVRRVLLPGGVLAAIEPDYGGMIEHPPEIATRELWLTALRRAGADPLVGRKLPGVLNAAGFEVQIDLLDRLVAPSAARFDLLGELPLSDSERDTLDRARQAAMKLGLSQVAHLPMFLITAEVPD